MSTFGGHKPATLNPEALLLRGGPSSPGDLPEYSRRWLPEPLGLLQVKVGLLIIHVSWDKNPGLYGSYRTDTIYWRVQIMGER